MCRARPFSFSGCAGNFRRIMVHDSMMKFTARIALAVVICVGLAGCQGGGLGGSEVTANVMQRSPAAATLINNYRKRRGLDPVAEDPRLMRAAAAHAQDLASSGKLSHTGSDRSDPSVRARRAGYVFSNVGENVSGGRASLTEVIQSWVDSPEHRENLEMKPASHFGLCLLYTSPSPRD